jgi:F0F1-type ATP synthase membrane subunit c/vacuolar-type H+-ATPase subunit K
MTFAQFEIAQWVIFFVLAAIAFIFQLPSFVCKSHWELRYPRLQCREYSIYWHPPWYFYTLLWLAAYIASALGNGFVWSDLLEQTVANPSQSNPLFLGGFICVLISYFASLFWTHLFLGRALPRFSKPEKNTAKHIIPFWVNVAFAMSTIAFVASLLALIFYWVETSVGWSMIFYPIFLLVIWIFNLLVVLNEHGWQKECQETSASQISWDQEDDLKKQHKRRGDDSE